MILSSVGIIASSGGVSPPVNTVAPTISGTNAVGNMLTATNGTWTGTAPISYTYQWKRDGVNISSATSITYTLVQADAGFNITCQVTATNALGTASALSNSLLCYDATAYAYNTAINLTSTTQTVAINELVLDLKAANLFAKFNALYPMITDKVTQIDIATQMKFNLINPADTNAAFRLAWNGGWTYASTGATPNGSSAYANTFLSTSAIGLNSGHLSYYSRTNFLSAGTVSEIGTLKPSPDSYSDLGLSNANATFFRFNNTTTFNSVATSNTQGFYVGTRTASNVIKTFKNGVNIINGTAPSSATSTVPFFIGASNNNGTPQFYSTKQCAFASIGSGLTDTESQLFYQIVEKYQVALSRNINPTQSFYYNRNYGNETNLYLFATQITNTTIQGAVNTLVADLKTAGIYTKMRAIYPMVTDKAVQVDMANQMKFNLVNPQDSNAAFRLTWLGGWTYGTTGATPNGSSGYANTFFIPASNLTSLSAHLSYYSRTNLDSYKFDFGVRNGFAAGNPSFGFVSKFSNTMYGYANVNESTGRLLTTNTDSIGLMCLSRNGTTTVNNYRNGASLGGAALAELSVTTYSVALAAWNDAGSISLYSSRQCAFASIGDGLSAAEVANFYTAVQNFQITLGRQV